MSYSWQILATDWNSLTDAEKESLFKGTNYQLPTIAELTALGKFKVAIYDDYSTQHKYQVKAVPLNQVVKPVKLISTKSFNNIDSVTISSSVSTDAVLKVAVTTDLKDYKVYNSSTGEWDVISDIETDGSLPSDIAAVPSSAWNILLKESEGIGFEYFMSIENISDVCKTDSLTLQVDMKGSWQSALKGTDFNYGYPANDQLKVVLLKDGSYKINYTE